MRNNKYVCGIPVPNNFKPKKHYARNLLHARLKRHHSESSSHILAKNVKLFEENEAITIEPTEAEIENKRLEEEKNINYIEKRLKPRFPWLQLSEGKLFCKVRNIPCNRKSV